MVCTSIALVWFSGTLAVAPLVIVGAVFSTMPVTEILSKAKPSVVRGKLSNCWNLIWTSEPRVKPLAAAVADKSTTLVWKELVELAPVKSTNLIQFVPSTLRATPSEFSEPIKLADIALSSSPNSFCSKLSVTSVKPVVSTWRITSLRESKPCPELSNVSCWAPKGLKSLVTWILPAPLVSVSKDRGKSPSSKFSTKGRVAGTARPKIAS